MIAGTIKLRRLIKNIADDELRKLTWMYYFVKYDPDRADRLKKQAREKRQRYYWKHHKPRQRIGRWDVV